LIVASELASHVGDEDMSATYTADAELLKKTINDVLWDDEAGMYRDNESS